MIPSSCNYSYVFQALSLLKTQFQNKRPHVGHMYFGNSQNLDDASHRMTWWSGKIPVTKDRTWCFSTALINLNQKDGQWLKHVMRWWSQLTGYSVNIFSRCAGKPVTCVCICVCAQCIHVWVCSHLCPDCSFFHHAVFQLKMHFCFLQHLVLSIAL